MTGRAPAPGLGTPTQADSFRRNSNDDPRNSLDNLPRQVPTASWLWMRRRARWWRHAEGASIATIAPQPGLGEQTVLELLGGAP
jgi:hypothetical protein